MMNAVLIGLGLPVGVLIFLMILVAIKSTRYRKIQGVSSSTPNPSTGANPAPVAGTAPATAPTPAGNEALGWAIIVTGLIVVIGLIVFGICRAFPTVSASATRSPVVPAVTVSPLRGEVKHLHLTETPVCVPREEGSVGCDYDPAPGANPKSHFQIRSGNGPWYDIIGGQKKGPMVNLEEPVYFRTKHGDPPVDITFKWNPY